MKDIDKLAEAIHAISTDKGFTPPSLDNLPEKLMLSVSELAEALEEHRSDKPLVYYEENLQDGLKKPEGILVEIADSVIRNLHMMHSLLEEANAHVNTEEQWTVSDVIDLKVRYNAGRPSMHGGRKY